MTTVQRVQPPTGGGGTSKPKPPRKPPSPPPPPPPPPAYNPPSDGGSSSGGYTPPPQNRDSGTQARRRAEERRRRAQERRERAENIRGRNQELRLRRERSRLMSVENSLLGTPMGERNVLPFAIGERWNRGSNQAIATGTYTTVQFGTNTFDATAAGYSQMYSDTTNLWTIPAGLTGIWRMSGIARFAGHATGRRVARILMNGATTIYEYYIPAGAAIDINVIWSSTYPLEAGQYVEFQVWQNSGGSLNLLGGAEMSNASMEFLGANG